MGYQPQRWLERLATSVLPAESREHVLGDLVECSETRNDYLRNLASALPCVWAATWLDGQVKQAAALEEQLQ